MAYDYNLLAENAKKFSKTLTDSGITASVKTSRYQRQIKAVEVASSLPINDLFKTIGVNGRIIDLPPEEERSISGKYKAKFVSLGKGYDFFIVNTFTEKGSIKTKDLAPEKFGLTNKVYTKISEFDKDVYDGIKNLKKIEPNVIIAITELYKAVTNNSSENIPYSDKLKQLMDDLKPQDRQAIGKDFGEIMSLRWCLSQSFTKGWNKFAFSTVSNEALVDYYVLIPKGKVEVPVNISAKFEGGAAPSIKAIAESIDKLYKTPTPEQKTASNILKSLAGINSAGNVSSKILGAFRALNNNAYKELQKILKNSNPTIQDISQFIQKIAKGNSTPENRIAEFKKVFGNLFALLNRDINNQKFNESLRTVFSTTSYSKYYSLVISPMGYSLVGYMNKTPVFQEILNNASRQLQIQQVYLFFRANNIQFQKKVFSESKFNFSYGANAKDSDNTNIKFEMS